MTYADSLPALVRAVGASDWAAEFPPETLTRWMRYNVYSIPRRTNEILEVVREYGIEQRPGLGSVLDLGCGFGGMLHFLASEGLASKCVGIDTYLPPLCSFGKARTALGGRVPDLICADEALLPFASGVFDVVLSYDTLYFRGVDKGAVLREARRVLRPGGVMVIKVVNPWFPLYAPFLFPGIRRVTRPLLRWLERRARRSWGLRNASAASAVTLQAILRQAGFVQCELFLRGTRRHSGIARWVQPDLVLVACAGGEGGSQGPGRSGPTERSSS